MADDADQVGQDDSDSQLNQAPVDAAATDNDSPADGQQVDHAEEGKVAYEGAHCVGSGSHEIDEDGHQVAGALGNTIEKGAVVAGDAGEGEGLGLKTMFHRCNLFGGSLDVSTHEEGGTRVRCCFPLHPEQQVP